MTGSPELFAIYQSLDYAAIKRMVDAKEEENIHTEFKRWSQDHFRPAIPSPVNESITRPLISYFMAPPGVRPPAAT